MADDDAGGKGRSLADLGAHGFPVPPWAVLGADVLAGLLDAAEVDALLAGLTPDTAEAVAAKLGALVTGREPDEATRARIAAVHRAAGGGRVAVRSSGVDEDGARHSFAGQFTTVLDVEGEAAVCAAVLECWASAFSARSLVYRLRHGIPVRRGGMAVVVQRMVDADASGVLFTANPLNGDHGQQVVSAVYGLGEGLVSGAVDADTVVLDGRTGAVLETTIGEKATRFDAPGPGRSSGSNTVVTEVPPSERDSAVLDARQLTRLHELGRQVEAAFGAPQDIEWAFDGDDLWVLQSRPITTLPQGELRIWDNANIIESFSGLVSPLTYTFAADAYARVYRGYARALRVPRRQLRQMDDWLPSMLGYFHGRVYYNLLHWYRMVRLAPGYRLTRRVLEVSLGVDETLPDAQADALHPFTFRTRLGARVSRTVSTLEFARRFRSMDRAVERFAVAFDDAHRVFDRVDYDALSGEETFRRFRDLERDLLDRWGPMMALDATLLLTLGALHLLTKRWLPDAPAWLTPAAANPGPDVESAAPARALTALADRVRADPALSTVVTGTPLGELRGALGAFPEFAAAVEDYLERYGYRSPDELKLEVPDLREDPSLLFAMLRDALPVSPDERPDLAQEYLDRHLRGFRRRIYEVVRGKARRSLAARERLRFCRTRAFGSAKRMLRAMGRDLERVGALDDWQDVFLLRLDELRGAFEGVIAHRELPELVALRRRQREEDAALRAPSRFTTRGSAYWGGNLEAAGWAPDVSGGSGRTTFQGTPSCPGTAEGRAVVTSTPVDVQGGILVAYRTDPGWVAALSAASGLVIERGSPLTHVAIVARELGIPTVVQVKDITRELVTGDRIRLDGATGAIAVLEPAC